MSVDIAMLQQPGFAVGQIESPDYIVGSDDPLDEVRRDPARTFVDMHHEGTPFSFASQADLLGEEDEEVGYGDDKCDCAQPVNCEGNLSLDTQLDPDYEELAARLEAKNAGKDLCACVPCSVKIIHRKTPRCVSKAKISRMIQQEQ